MNHISDDHGVHSRSGDFIRAFGTFPYFRDIYSLIYVCCNAHEQISSGPHGQCRGWVKTSGSRLGGGFDVVFVETLSEKLTCPICHLALKEPRLTDCGDHFCGSCLTHSLQRSPSCPICRTELEASKIYPNNALKREILDLKIKCDRHNKGCKWVSELRNHEVHGRACVYTSENCINECGEMVMRKDMDDHAQKQCLRRRVHCEHCGQLMQWLKLHDHYKECSRYPTKCMYNCGEMVLRCQMADHIGMWGTCPNSPLECDFKTNGCQFKGKRNDLLKHIETDTTSHLSLIAMELTETKQKLESTDHELAATKQKLVDTENKFKDLSKELSMYHPLEPPKQAIHTWRIENWCQKVLDAQRESNPAEKISSSSFYVGPGYHMYISAYPDGNAVAAKSHLGVYLNATKGNFDHEIAWPFPFSFVLEVVDQQRDGQHISVECSPPYGTFLASTETDTGYGIPNMASHEKLWSRCYIQKETIHIRLTVDLKKSRV